MATSALDYTATTPQQRRGRQLLHYPATASRRMHLALVVAITVALY